MKTEIIDWADVEPAAEMPMVHWLAMMTMAQREADLLPPHIGEDLADRTSRADRFCMSLDVKLSRDRLGQTASAAPGAVMKRPREGRPGRQKLSDLVDRGTPETRRKLRADEMAKLHRQGAVDDVHMTAADQIAQVREALGRGLTPGAAPISTRVQGGVAWRDPISRMTQSEQAWWRLRYRPWLIDLIADPITRETKTKRQKFYCAVGLTMAVVCENWTIQEAEQYCGLPTRKGMGRVILRIALDRYALMAGMRSGERMAETRAFENAA